MDEVTMRDQDGRVLPPVTLAVLGAELKAGYEYRGQFEELAAQIGGES